MPYPSLGFGEDYIDTPQTTKRGFIVPVTKEAIFFDRTHLILQRAAEVGEVLGLNKEKRLLDLLHRRRRTTTSGRAPPTTPTAARARAWPPTATGSTRLTEELVDWTDVDAAEQLFADILDPNTGEPVLIQATTVLVMPAYRHAANRIFNATEIYYTPARSDDHRGRQSAGQLHGGREPAGLPPHDRRRPRRRRTAKKWWFIGDFRKAFAYMENWPITILFNYYL